MFCHLFLLGHEPGFCMMCTMQNHIIQVFANSGNVIKPIGVLNELKSKWHSWVIEFWICALVQKYFPLFGHQRCCRLFIQYFWREMFKSHLWSRCLNYMWCHFWNSRVFRLVVSVIQGLQSTSAMEARRMHMSSCGIQWMLCKSPAYLEPSEFQLNMPPTRIFT